VGRLWRHLHFSGSLYQCSASFTFISWNHTNYLTRYEIVTKHAGTVQKGLIYLHSQPRGGYDVPNPIDL
jgi:hypothetical protein